MANPAEECELHGLMFCVECNPSLTGPIPTVRNLGDGIVARFTGRGHWTEKELRLAENLNLSDAEVADLVNRSTAAVHQFRYNHGIVAKSQERNLDYDAPRVMARWTEAELDFVKDHIGTMTAEELSAALGRSIPAVERMIARFR